MRLAFIPMLAVTVFFWSCSGTEETKTADTGAVEETTEEASGDAVNPMADFKFHTMLANLPSPLETFHIISDVEIETSEIAMTDLAVASELSTATAKAYGYGMYMTDMGFMAYEHESQKTLDYFQVNRQLAQDLGAGEVFDRTISANFEENSSDEAKFVRMMDEAFNAMDEYMVDNERFVNATEIFVGSWVESQILATRILKDHAMTEANRPIYEAVYSQKIHASNLINVLGEIDIEIGEDVYEAVEDIMMFYAGFSDVESISQEDLSTLEGKLDNLKTLLLS